MESQTNAALPSGRPKRRLWTGFVLIALGLLFLFGEIGTLDLRPIAQFWPLILIALGAARLAVGTGRERWSGYWILVAGIYCSIGTWKLFGLTWQAAWPVFLIAAGLSVILRGGRN